MSTAKQTAIERLRMVRGWSEEKVAQFRAEIAAGKQIGRAIAWAREACMAEHVAAGLARAEELLAGCGDDAAAVAATLGPEADKVRDRILRSAHDVQNADVMQDAIARVEGAADREVLERLREAIDWAQRAERAAAPAGKGA